MLHATDYLINVNGCAYSNLFYPEIPFWAQAGKYRYLFEMKDFFRRKQIQKADYWIFETEVLRKRAIELCNFPEERVGVVNMAPSQLVKPENVKGDLLSVFESKLPKKFKFLHLCGPHPNKRLVAMAAITREMVKQGARDFCVVFTINCDSDYAKMVQLAFVKEGVEDYLELVGPVASDECATLIDCCDVMCTFSILESFSNNFIEAWRMRKPLVVTDSDWSRGSCGGGALYLNPENSFESAGMLRTLLDNDALRKDVIEKGSLQLANYPTPEEKLNLYLIEMEKAKFLGPCPSEERRCIKWPVICSR